MKPGHYCAITSLLGLVLVTAALAKEVQKPLPLPADFSTTIDNMYWPISAVGQSIKYFSETEDGCEYNKLTVTSDTDVIDDYTVVTVRDQAWVNEPVGDEECSLANAELEEDTLDYYAQDNAGNIWYFGEETLSFDDNGACTDEGTWLAGDGDAIPGIIMLANPLPGQRYRQELKEGEAEDWGSVLRLNVKVSIEAGEYEGCLVTKEWTPLEPGAIEHKYYCPEVGNPGPGLVLVEELHGKSVYVEYVGTGDFGIPGEFDAFPALDCP